jgi:hypothetical protein
LLAVGCEDAAGEDDAGVESGEPLASIGPAESDALGAAASGAPPGTWGWFGAARSGESASQRTMATAIGAARPSERRKPRATGVEGAVISLHDNPTWPPVPFER